MKTSGERLKYYFEKQGVSIRKVCLQNKISYNSFNQILNNSRALGLNTLLQVVKVYPKLNMNWVILGVGNPEIEEEGTYIVKDQVNTLNENPTDYIKEPKNSKNSKILFLEEQLDFYKDKLIYWEKSDIEKRLRDLEDFNEILRLKFGIYPE